MAGIHASIETCFEVDDELIDRTLALAAGGSAVAQRDHVLALLARMAGVARPRQGAARMLLVFVRLAACEWVEADVLIELAARGDRTLVSAYFDDDRGRRPLHAPFDVDAPLDEFRRALDGGAEELAALEIRHSSASALEVHACGNHTRETLRAPGASRAVAAGPESKRQPPPLPARSARGDMLAKATVKMPAVHIPREAFRDDEDQPPKSRIFSGSPPVAPADDLDDGWD